MLGPGDLHFTADLSSSCVIGDDTSHKYDAAGKLSGRFGLLVLLFGLFVVHGSSSSTF